MVIRDDNIKIEKKKSPEEIEREQLREKERLRKKMLLRAQNREMENAKLAKKEAKRKIKQGIRDEPKVEVRVPQVKPMEVKAPPPGLTKGERDKWYKEQEKKEILRQIAIDKAIRTGKPVELEDENRPKTIEEKFIELFEKMEKIYPIRTPKAAKLARCLDTVRIYLCKLTFKI